MNIRRYFSLLLICSLTFASSAKAGQIKASESRFLEQGKSGGKVAKGTPQEIASEATIRLQPGQVGERLPMDQALFAQATKIGEGGLSPAGKWVKENVSLGRPITDVEANLLSETALKTLMEAPDRVNMYKDVPGMGKLTFVQSDSARQMGLFLNESEFLGFGRGLKGSIEGVPSSRLLSGGAKYSRESLQSLRSFSQDVESVAGKYGLTMEEFYRLLPERAETLTIKQRSRMIAIRESVPKPTSNTLLEKVIPEADIQKYMDGKYNTVQGFVTRGQDTQGLKDPFNSYQTLRLDYENTKFNPYGDKSIGVIRFKTPEAGRAVIPFSDSMGGRAANPYPNTGNGFTAAENGRIIPEFEFPKANGKGVGISHGSELFEISKNGVEKLRAVYDERRGRFIPVP